MIKSYSRTGHPLLHAALIQLLVVGGCADGGPGGELAESLPAEPGALMVVVSNGITGEPVADVDVLAYEMTASGGAWRGREATTAEGRASFVLDGLGEGKRYRLRLQPYGAGDVWTEDIDAPGVLGVEVGTSPVSLVSGGAPATLAGVTLTAHVVDAGKRSLYKEGRTDGTGTVHFDFEALDQGATVVVRAEDPLGTGESVEIAPIIHRGPAAVELGPLPEQSRLEPAGLAASCAPTAASGSVYYVSATGNDNSGNGSQTRPWATIRRALGAVPDGSTILVASGTYTNNTLAGRFSKGVVVRAETMYKARLRGSSTASALRCYDCAGITVEGFDIAHAGAGAKPLVVQIEGEKARHITLRNNIIHDSYNNDLLKINNGASHIKVERNVFYNQHGTDEHIDINSVADVIVQDNIFFNDFKASGRSNGNNTSSYIVIKDSNGDDDHYVGTQRVTVRRNVFMNWEGGSGFNFILIGEDAKSYVEARNILLENNLFLGNSGNQLRAPLGVKSGADVVFRNNTVTGDLPSRAFAMRLNSENPKMQNRNIQFYNNIWSDPTGTMERFSTTPSGETASFTLDNNLYWNGGRAIPKRSDDLINHDSDSRRIEANPRLPDPSRARTPVWSGTSFADGSSTMCEAFVKLVAHGTPASGSPVIDAARSNQAPADDILGRPRSRPDIGAVERQ